MVPRGGGGFRDRGRDSARLARAAATYAPVRRLCGKWHRRPRRDADGRRESNRPSATHRLIFRTDFYPSVFIVNIHIAGIFVESLLMRPIAKRFVLRQSASANPSRQFRALGHLVRTVLVMLDHSRHRSVRSLECRVRRTDAAPGAIKDHPPRPSQWHAISPAIYCVFLADIRARTADATARRDGYSVA
jgi:hypothetical protein